MKKALSLTLAACTAMGCMTMFGCGDPVPDPIDDNYRVFYQIFVGSFSDSDGDGTGDIRGIINRMDYLNDGDINSGKSLGVQGLWLSPIFESPSYHKYDAKDYYKIDPKFGTEEDLKELLEICHARNVKVIIDLAINHTAKSNEWFEKFIDARRKNDDKSEYYDFYTCVDADAQLSNHTYYPLYAYSGLYYEGNFDSGMPEVNYDSTFAKNTMLDVARHWLEFGVDGFRFDAIKYIYYYETEKNAEFWKWYMDELRAIKPDVYTVGECWSGSGEILEYYPAMNCFDFSASQVAGTIAGAVRGQIGTFTRSVENFQKNALEKNADAMYIPFIANHDTDRAAGFLPTEQLTSTSETTYSAFMAANIYLLCTGSPFIYYGEEIGMQGTRGSANTDANRRLAMLWGDDDTVKDPSGTTFGKDKQTNGTVASQKKDKNSLMNHYRKVISLRNKYPQIARGNYTSLTAQGKLGGFSIDYNSEKTVLLHNVGLSSVTVDVTSFGVSVSELLDYIGMGKAKLKGNNLEIGAQTSVILK